MVRHSLRALAGALLVLGVLCAPALAQSTPPIGAYSTANAYSFVSAPNLHPPKLKTDMATVSNKLAPGYFFIANFKNLGAVNPTTQQPLPLQGSGGPVILDQKLQPVWAAPVPNDVYSLNFQPQSYQGKPALSWWQGVVSPTGAVSNGTWEIYDQHYRHVASLVGQQGWTLSMHELVLRQGSACTAPGWNGGNDECAWATAYKNVPATSLTDTGGSNYPNVTVVDSAVQEYDVKTGALVYNWDAGQHIPLEQSQTKPANGFWDPYHVNSIWLVGDGTFLTSMRNTWSGYDVNINSGSIVWTLGGKASSFTIPTNGQFSWQHDMEMHGANVTMFDDACCAVLGPGQFAPPNGQSQGLVLSLDIPKKTASFVAAYNYTGRETSTQGNMNLLSNGNVLVGWGQASYFTEYAQNGQRLLDAVFPTPDISYRTYESTWTGTPFYKPRAVAHKNHGKVTVWVSWDGATKVVKWRVIGGSNPNHLATLLQKTKKGFETKIVLPKQDTMKEYKLVALDSKGKVLARSKVVKPSKGKGGGGGSGNGYGGNGGGGVY